MGSEYVIELSRATFTEKVLKNPSVVLVDFWAEWCGPCRQAAPLMEELAKQHVGKITVCKVNIDQERQLAEQYNIQSIPSFLLFKQGKLVEQIVGNRFSKKQWEEKLGVLS